ncbi:chorion peroxidase-like [Daphnia carinata]|uniref:chorion peroxidase-like n=1 Tax=Daphnia carinata TaxID=120202 RepID=UPI002868860F|nr:chorion peroxidase-like [Daphnia carinata]
MNQAAEASRSQMISMSEIEKRLNENNILVLPGSSRALHALVFATTTESEQISRQAILGAYAASDIVKRFDIEPENVAQALNQLYLKDTTLSDTCPADAVCNQTTIDSRYRTLDGSCNNVQHSSWGKSLTPFQRVIPSAYADGVRVPRRAKSGRELPSARLISTTVTRDVDAPSETDTTWVMQYGQFLDHDFTRTPEFRMANSSTIPCCMPNGGFIDKNLVHPECFPIEIPRNDAFFSRFGQRCMPLVRSAPGRRPDCSLGCVEQMNQFTHYLDQSNVYGSDDKLASELRTFQEGKLKATHRSDLDLLPADEASKVSCALSKRVSGIDPPAEVKCFKAGDTPRVNEHPNLAVTHIVFLREHNRLAEELARLNSHWDDERLYQEARRILTAQMQHITYNEWLPIIIGREKMQQLGLLPLQRGFSQDYDSNLNPTIFNEFAGAAFRFGHTLIQGRHHLTNARGTKERDILLRQHFFKTQEIYTPGNLDKFLIGLATQPGQKPENYFSQELTNHLFEEEGKGFGLDLVSLNIQRGRDHGLPGYNAYRSICGLSTANDFNDLRDLIPSPIVDRFESLYESMDDIDLFIGSISERLANGAVVGPTFQCLIAEQFLRLKRGDRYFYDLSGQSGSFTEEQLNEIRRTSFARLVCDNSNVRSIQPLIFKSKAVVNPIVDCESSSILRVNLHPWQEA